MLRDVAPKWFTAAEGCALAHCYTLGSYFAASDLSSKHEVSGNNEACTHKLGLARMNGWQRRCAHHKTTWPTALDFEKFALTALMGSLQSFGVNENGLAWQLQLNTVFAEVLSMSHVDASSNTKHITSRKSALAGDQPKWLTIDVKTISFDRKLVRFSRS